MSGTRRGGETKQNKRNKNRKCVYRRMTAKSKEWLHVIGKNAVIFTHLNIFKFLVNLLS